MRAAKYLEALKYFSKTAHQHSALGRYFRGAIAPSSLQWGSRLKVYNALTRRNTFALSLHHRTADTADSAVLLNRLAAGNDASLHQNISDIAKDLTNLLEFNNSYPLLLYFRYHQTYYALPRIVYLTIDTAILINSAIDAEQYGAVANSAGAAEIWCGSMHLVRELEQSIAVKVRPSPQEPDELLWQEHYYHALAILNKSGIKTTKTPESGAKSYLSMRQEWGPGLAKLTQYMDYQPSQIYSLLGLGHKALGN